MTFLQKKPGWIGVDLGVSSVKIAQLVWREGRLVIGSTAQASRRKSWLTDGKCRQASLLPASSKSELSEAVLIGKKWQGNTAAASLSLAVADVYQAPLPNEGFEDPTRCETFRKAALYPLELRQLDWWPAAANAKNPPHAMVASLPQAWSELVCKELAQQKWNCRAIDLLSWSLARAIGLADSGGQPSQARPGIYAAIDWGCSKATCILYRDGVPILMRSLKDGGFANIVGALKEQLGANELETRELIQSAGAEHSGSAASRVVSKLIARHWRKFESELLRTLDYWESQTRGEKLEQIYLFGGGAGLGDAQQRISGITSVKTTRWSFPQAPQSNNQQPIPSFLLGSAVGLSAMAWEKS
ncbi:MAG: pilus assembly protein PilM [Lacipirellulaceae bacterium]